jgi:predicted ribosome-associated RNA-binding protein Tma20
MLYYVQSGDVDGRQEAQTHKEAALAVASASDQLGRVVVVSESPITFDNDDEVYFSVKSLLIQLNEQRSRFKVVGGST